RSGVSAPSAQSPSRGPSPPRPSPSCACPPSRRWIQPWSALFFLPPNRSAPALVEIFRVTPESGGVQQPRPPPGAWWPGRLHDRQLDVLARLLGDGYNLGQHFDFTVRTDLLRP